MLTTAVASVFMGKIYGDWAAIAISVMILFTAFASVFALMLGYSRVPYAAALDGAFFRWFGVLHPKGEFPHRSLVLIGVLCIVASFFGLSDIITALVLARILVVFGGQIIGLFILRKYRREVARPFKMWLYPVPAVLALVGWLYAFGSGVAEPGGLEVRALRLRHHCRGLGGLFPPGLEEAGVALRFPAWRLAGLSGVGNGFPARYSPVASAVRTS